MVEPFSKEPANKCDASDVLIDQPNPVAYLSALGLYMTCSKDKKSPEGVMYSTTYIILEGGKLLWWQM